MTKNLKIVKKYIKTENFYFQFRWICCWFGMQESKNFSKIAKIAKLAAQIGKRQFQEHFLNFMDDFTIRLLELYWKLMNPLLKSRFREQKGKKLSSEKKISYFSLTLNNGKPQ